MTAARLAGAVPLAVASSCLVVPVLLAPPAAATTCGGGPGVTVVVDRADLGGGVSTGCDGDGGPAQDNFADTGVQLRFAQRDPGFVCRVDGVPTSDPCVNTSPTDAYWGLWWSDGTSGRWTYSSVGIGSLSVPAGGAVAFRFSTGDEAPPAVAPPVATPEGRASPGTPVPAPGDEQETALVDDRVDPQSSDRAAADGLPGWVAPVLVVALLALGGAVAGIRRLRGASGRP